MCLHERLAMREKNLPSPIVIEQLNYTFIFSESHLHIPLTRSLPYIPLAHTHVPMHINLIHTPIFPPPFKHQSLLVRKM